MVGESLVLLMAGVLAQAPAAAGGATIAASAGLGGLCKPWHWTPVRVELAATDEDIAGVLRVEWGDARVSQHVDVPAPSRRVFELYIRTGDPRSALHVQLENHSRELPGLDVPVRIAAVDDPIVVCAPRGASNDAACSVTMVDEALPASWRGYDAATEVRIASGADLTAEQRRALGIFRAKRRVENAGAVTPPFGALPDEGRATRRSDAALELYIVLMAVAPVFWSWRRFATAIRATALAAVVASTAVLAAMIGRSSPPIIRHATVAEQFEYEPATLVSMRGVAVFPTRRRFSMRATIDGAIDQRGAAAGADERFDAAGRPVLEADAYLGASQRFTLEGASRFRALAVSRADGVIRVSNVSGHALTDCEWPDGTFRPVNVLAPGAAVETTSALSGPDPSVSCRFSGAPVDFVDSGTTVATEGSTTVVYHLASAGTNDDLR